MFKKLKDKLAEDLKLSPQRIAEIAQTVQNYGSPTVTNSSKPTIADDKHFSIADEDSQDVSPNVEGFTNISLVENQTPKGRRTSSSSIASDVSFLPRFDISSNAYHLQSDLDISASEIDEFSSVHSEKVDNVSKENLYRAYRSMQAKYNKYRGRYTDLARHYKDLEHQNEKAKAILGDTQDKALRRVSELKEQCALEQRAKAHLEEALRMEIDEKQLEIDALKQKVGLLQKTSGLPVDVSIDINSPSNSGSPEKLSLLEAEVKAKDMIILDLRKREDDALKAKKNESDKVEQLSNQIESVRLILEDKNSSMIILQKEIDNYQQHTNELQRHVDILTQEVEQRKRETEQNSKKVSYLNEEKALLKSTFDEIKNEYEQLKIEKDKETKVFEVQIAELKQDIKSTEELRNLCSEKSERIAQLEEKITSLDDEIDILKSSVLPLQDQVEALQSKNSELQETNERQTTKIGQLMEDLGNVRATNSGLNVKIKELEAIICNLERMFNLTEEHLQTVRAESEEKRNLLEEQRQQVHSLESKLHQLRFENEAHLLQITSLKQEEHQSETHKLEQNKILQSQLEEKDTILNSLKNTINQIQQEQSSFQTNQCVQLIQQIRSTIIESLFKHIQSNSLSNSFNIPENEPVGDVALNNFHNFIEKQVELISNDVAVLKNIYDNNFNVISSLNFELNETKTQLGELETRKVQIEQISEENKNLKENIDSLNNQVEELKVFKVQLEATHVEREKLLNEIVLLKEKTQISTKLAEEMNENIMIIDKLNCQIEEMKEQLEESEQKLEEMQEGMDELRSTISQKNQTIAQLEAQICDLRDTMDKLHVEKDAANISLENQIAELETLRVQVETKKRQLTEIPKLNLELVESKTLIDDYIANISDLQFQLEEVKKLKMIEAERNDEFKSQMLALQTQLDSKNSDLERLTNQYNEQVAELKKNIENSTKSEVTSFKAKADALEQELEQVQHEMGASMEDYQSQVSSLLLKISDLENCNLADKDALKYAQEQLHKLVLKNNKLERKLDETIVTLNHATSLNDSTEMEYLRNILFQYMTGKEPVVLAGVIAAVCKFSEEQTDLVVQREHQKTTLLGTLGFI